MKRELFDDTLLLGGLAAIIYGAFCATPTCGWVCAGIAMLSLSLAGYHKRLTK